LASSTNSREFIQRRGRVLRSHQDKFSAQVHDCLVLPAESADDPGDEVSILRTELRRSAEFAEHARNKAIALKLNILARRHGIDDFEIATGEIEEQDNA
jgi:superfamily II DNA or RNA helicase